MRCAGQVRFVVAAVMVSSAGCRRSSLVDLPLWRVEPDPSGREVRVVQLPFEQNSYDLTTYALVRRVLDRNQDGISDRIITYEGFGGARTEETDLSAPVRKGPWSYYHRTAEGLQKAVFTTTLIFQLRVSHTLVCQSSDIR